MRYAVVSNGTVANIALASTPLASNWIRSDTANIGDHYDATTGVFAAPVAPPAPEPSNELTKIEYLKRFTQDERIAIRAAGKVNSVVEDYIELMNAAVIVHKDDPNTIAGLNALTQAGILAPGRAAEILA